MIQIKQYEVIVNEKNGTCGFVFDLNQYPLKEFLQKSLQYEVFYKEGKVKVFNLDEEIWFDNLTEELLYYVVKSIEIAILGGVNSDTEEDAKIVISTFATLI